MLAVSIYIGQRPKGGDPALWFLGSGVAFFFAIFVPTCFFVLHPMFVRLDSHRREALAARPPKQPQRRERPPQESVSTPSRVSYPTLWIVAATYGTGAFRADVVAHVRNLVSEGEIHFMGGDGSYNNALGGDPLPNTRKSLEIQWKLGDETQPMMIFDEDSQIHLPPYAGQ